ncbi:MAG: hypothetical protein ACK5P5_03665 [Pseudobdellovibrionaceae bacterium]
MTIVSIYTFRNAESANQAIEALWRRLSGGFDRTVGSSGSEIWITNFCDDAYLAGQICESNGGSLK